MKWILLDHDKIKWQGNVKNVMNPQAPQNLWNFLTSQRPTSFSRYLINAVN
jgi:hypothetical protein